MPAPKINPRGNTRGGTPRPFPPRSGTALWYGLALLIVLGLVNMYYMVPAGRQLAYSEFKTLVQSGQIEEVLIGDQTLRGTLKQSAGAKDDKARQFPTTRVDDPKLAEELQAGGVKFSGESINRWLTDVLGWVPPLIFIVVLWGFFFRRMSGPEGGVMSFARSRAKIYADDEVKVKFSDVAGVDEARDELAEIVEFLKNPRKYTNLGGRIPKGVLLVGPPGTGKT